MGVTDRKSKPHQDKGLDALLNDVQKGKPDSPQSMMPRRPFRRCPQSDITRVMAEVKNPRQGIARGSSGKRESPS